jgi:hypothetical protein
MILQTLLTFLIVLIAVIYLIRRYFFRTKKPGACGGCESGCGINSKQALACDKPLANTLKQSILVKDIKRKPTPSSK